MPTEIEKCIENAVMKHAGKTDGKTGQPVPLSVSELALSIGTPVTTKDVIAHLKYMQASGTLDLGDQVVPDDVNFLRIDRVCSHGEIVVKLDLFNQPEISREESGKDEITDEEGKTIRCVVMPEKLNDLDGSTGRWILSIIRDPEDTLEELVVDKIFEGEDVMDGRAKAWSFWDEFKLGYSPFSVEKPAGDEPLTPLSWLARMVDNGDAIEDGGNLYIYVKPDAFEVLREVAGQEDVGIKSLYFSEFNVTVEVDENGIDMLAQIADYNASPDITEPQE